MPNFASHQSPNTQLSACSAVDFDECNGERTDSLSGVCVNINRGFDNGGEFQDLGRVGPPPRFDFIAGWIQSHGRVSIDNPGNYCGCDERKNDSGPNAKRQR